MAQNKIDIKTGTLFPWTFQFIAGIVFLIGLSIIVDRPVLSLCLIAASVFVFSGYTGMEIDKEKSNYREYMSFFFIKSGKKIKYNGIDKIFINSTKVKQQMHTAHTSHSSIFTNLEFNGYLKLENGEKIHLLTKRKKEKLVYELNKIALFLDVQIDDTVERQVKSA